MLRVEWRAVVIKSARMWSMVATSTGAIGGVSVGGVYASEDGGQTWEGRNKGLVASYLPDPHAQYGHDPHCTVAAPANPQALWQQNHCGVFRSTDTGRNWADVSESDGPVGFGFPIVVDEQDPDTAWVAPGLSDDQRMAVGGALCISRTEDGGQTWTALRDGLPQLEPQPRGAPTDRAWWTWARAPLLRWTHEDIDPNMVLPHD